MELGRLINVPCTKVTLQKLHKKLLKSTDIKVIIIGDSKVFSFLCLQLDYSRHKDMSN